MDLRELVKSYETPKVVPPNPQVSRPPFVGQPSAGYVVPHYEFPPAYQNVPQNTWAPPVYYPGVPNYPFQQVNYYQGIHPQVFRVVDIVVYF